MKLEKKLFLNLLIEGSGDESQAYYDVKDVFDAALEAFYDRLDDSGLEWEILEEEVK